jgi:ribokinase
MIVFGSANYDITISTPAIPKLDHILTIESAIHGVGGKGANQAVVARRADSEVSLYATLGDDALGDIILKSLRAEGVNVQGITRRSHSTGLGLILAENGHHRVIYVQGANRFLDPQIVPEEILERGTMVLIQGDVPMGANEALLQRAKDHGCITTLNLGPYAFIREESLKLVDYLIVNQHEGEALAAQLRLDASNKHLLAANISQRFGCTFLITLGSEGAVAATPQGGLIPVNAVPVQAVDTVGAGDTFVGYLATAIERGEKLGDALEQASIAAAIACCKVGAQSSIPYRREVEESLRRL